MTNDQIPRSLCPTSGLPLYAMVEPDGRVLGVCSHDLDDVPPATPFPRGHRELPLFGTDTPYDLVTEVRERPTYLVEGDRVIRSYAVRPKLAAELLREISWWYGALHSSDAAQVSPAFERATRRHLPDLGVSPSQVNDSARRMTAKER